MPEFGDVLAEDAMVAGADGSTSGWIVVLRPFAGGEAQVRSASDFAQLLDITEETAIVAVDVPIGLLDVPRPGGRLADSAARALLKGKASSVFSAPPRCALHAEKYDEANAACRATGGPALSRQSFGILPRIRDVDDHMTSSLQERVLEVHPELSFAELNGGRAVLSRKKDPDGRDERLRLLVERAGFADAGDILLGPRPAGVASDDLLDAFAACWTAGRIAGGEGVRVPEPPEVDSRGLRMEIWR